jgi:hypothetical protein
VKFPHTYLRYFRLAIVRSLVVYSLLLLLASASYSQIRRHGTANQIPHPTSTAADVPSGFLPGAISIFAGNGTTAASGTNPYMNGVIANETPLDGGGPGFVATDSEGDIVFAVTGTNAGHDSYVYMVYEGGSIPPILAAVTTQASVPLQPQKGHIYLIVSNPDQTAVSNGTPASQAGISTINSLWFDSADNLYLADPIDDIVIEIDHATAQLHTVAGVFSTPGSYSVGDTIDSIPATSALLNPFDAKTDAYGNIYIGDSTDAVVLVVYSGTQPPPVLLAEGRSASSLVKGDIYTVTGVVANSCYTDLSETCASSGPANGFILGSVTSIFVDSSGNVYILDGDSGIILVVYAGGTVPSLLTAEGTTSPTPGNVYAIAGYNNLYTPCSAAPCGDGGLAESMSFVSPQDISVDAGDNVYISDSRTHAVRKIDTSGYASTIAGIDDPNQTPAAVPTVAANGAATSTQLNSPAGIAFDSQNNLYVTDESYQIVWGVAPSQPQSITFPALDSPVTYGVSPIPLDATSTSGLPVQYSVSSISPASVSGSGSSAELVVNGVGTVDITASQPGNGKYSAAQPISQQIKVSPAPLTVIANDISETYGDFKAPSFTASYSGFVNGDTQATALSGQPSFSTTATASSSYGAYPIVVTQGSLKANNYSFTFVNGTLTIAGSTPQTITFPALASVVYGQNKTIALNATASSGLPVQFTVISGPGSISGTTLTVAGGGSIVIAANQSGNNTYAGAPAKTQTLVVMPAPLTVTAPALSYPYGTAINPVSFPAPSITGFVGSDTAELVTGTAQYTTNASGTPNAGSYTLSIAKGTLALVPGAAANYALTTFVPGSITITAETQTISYLPLPTTIQYQQTTPVTVTASSGLPVSAALTGPLTFYGASVTNPGIGQDVIQVTPTGVGPATIILTQAGGGNYAAAPPIVLSFNIGKAPLDVAANNIIREQGAPNSTLTYGIGGNYAATGGFQDIPSVITGTPVLTTTADQNSPPGNYPIVVSQGTLVAPNYYFVLLNGTLTVTPPGNYTITANPASLTIPRGMSGQATLTLTPSNAYQGTVTLSCGQLPANVSCVISPSTYTFAGTQNADGSENPAQGTILINTAAGTVVGSLQPSNANIFRAAILFPGSLAGLLLAFGRRRFAKRSALWRLCAMLAFSLGMLTLSSCGGSSGFQTAAPGTINMTITGSGTTPSGSGSVTASVPFTITIQ